jgi:hypothetical protein
MRKWITVALLLFIGAACTPSAAPSLDNAASATPLTNPGSAPGESFELLYMFRDESVEATQAYQLGSVKTTVNGQTPPQTVLRRFPVDGITVPWDVRPPAALSPDGNTLAMVQWDEKIGAVLLIDAKTGQTTPIPNLKVSGLFTPTVLGWSLDGKQVYIFDETQPPGKVLAYHPTTNTLQPLLTLDDAAPESGLEVLSPDATHLVYCAAMGNRGCTAFAVRTLNDPQQKFSVTLPSGMACPGYPTLKWSLDSRTVAAACILNLRNFSVELIDAVSGERRSATMPFEVNDFAWAADNQRLLIDLCAGNYINVSDPDCGALQVLDTKTMKLSLGPAIERTEARRLYWQGNLIIFNESTGGGQEATMYFYDVATRQSKHFTRNASTYADASFTVMALRPGG